MPGPGRPEIGGQVYVRLGPLKEQVDAWAKERGLRQGEAIRQLIEIALNRETARSRQRSRPSVEDSKDEEQG